MAKATTGAKQREAQGWILGLIDQGARNTEIVNFLRSFDMGYRDSVMYGDINRLRAGVLSRQEIGKLGPGEAVPDVYLMPIHGPKLRDYTAKVTADYVDEVSKEIVTRTTTVHFKSNFSQNDVLDEMDKRAAFFKEVSNITLSRVTNIDYFKWEPDAP